VILQFHGATHPGTRLANTKIILLAAAVLRLVVRLPTRVLCPLASKHREAHKYIGGAATPGVSNSIFVCGIHVLSVLRWYQHMFGGA
jgi:hypothetical protein